MICTFCFISLQTFPQDDLFYPGKVFLACWWTEPLDALVCEWDGYLPKTLLLAVLHVYNLEFAKTFSNLRYHHQQQQSTYI